jgi:hypothetical protein
MIKKDRISKPWKTGVNFFQTLEKTDLVQGVSPVIRENREL